MAVGIPSLFAVGLLVAPLARVVPPLVALSLILLGTAAVVVLAERLYRGREARRGRLGIGPRGLTIFVVALSAYVILILALTARA